MLDYAFWGGGLRVIQFNAPRTAGLSKASPKKSTVIDVMAGLVEASLMLASSHNNADGEMLQTNFMLLLLCALGGQKNRVSYSD